MVPTPLSTPPVTIDKTRLAAMLERLRASKIAPPTNTEGAELSTPILEVSCKTETLSSIPETLSDGYQLDKNGSIIHYNSKQQEFVSLAGSGSSAVLIGAAGTGKTTCMKGTVTALIQNGLVGLLESGSHKHLVDGTPGLVICAYTRRAVNNIRKNLSRDVQSNCITIHKFLEYAPVYSEVVDPETGDSKTKMAFEPSRSPLNPIPPSVRTIIFEESSMIGTDLYKEVINACPHNPQLIFLGDIQQLSPVFGPAILGFKLLSLPVVELTEVYRQALESPIISLAHRILSGVPIFKEEFSKWKFPGQLTIHPWKKKISDSDALNTAGQFFIAAEKSGAYDPEEDMILLPFNKSFGTLELNKILANHLARKRSGVTYEVVAGFMRHYFTVGDRILYDKEDAIIESIEPNVGYTGAKPLVASSTLDYWGYDPVVHDPEPGTDTDMDFLLSQVAATTGEDRVQQSSHVLTLRMLDSDVLIKVDKASAINSMLLGYALTVHKSQGSEWRRVFVVLHHSHATMIQRELLYTAITRAKEELYVICEADTFMKGIASQKIKGETIAEKAEYFKGKITAGVDYE